MRKAFFLVFNLLLVVNTTSEGQSISDTLHVAVYDQKPFAYATSSGDMEGMMLDLWRDIAEGLNYTCTYHMVDHSALVTGLEEGQFDVGIGGITVTASREARIDFSHPVTFTGIAAAVSTSAGASKFNIYYRPILFSLLRIILVLCAFLLASAVVVWMIERRNRHQDRDRQIRHLGDGIWWSAVTISTVGYGDKVPHTTSGRVIGIIWIFIGVTLVSLFTANAAAILSKPAPGLESITTSDLYEMRVGAVRNSAAEEFLILNNLRYRDFEDVEDLVNTLLHEELDIAVGNAPELYELQNNEFSGQLTVSTKWLLNDYIAFAFQENSPYLEGINRSLLEHNASGRWERALYRYLGNDQ